MLIFTTHDYHALCYILYLSHGHKCPTYHIPHIDAPVFHADIFSVFFFPFSYVVPQSIIFLSPVVRYCCDTVVYERDSILRSHRPSKDLTGVFFFKFQILKSHSGSFSLFYILKPPETLYIYIFFFFMRHSHVHYPYNSL